MTRENSLIVDFPSKHRRRNASVQIYTDEATCEDSILQDRSVCFLPIRDTQYIGKRSKEEIQSTWYSKHEIKGFKKNALREAWKMQEILNKTPSEEFLSEDVICRCTGIEFNLSVKLKDVVYEKRNKYRYYVFREQQKQFDSRKKDADELARVSRKMSCWARKKAREIGKLSLNQKWL